jgi:acyl-CoA dehydrogenase
MPLVLNEDQLMFRDAAKRFTAERAPVAQLRQLRDDNDATGFSPALWKEMADMGWAGVLVPEEYGGVAFGYSGVGLIAEEIGRNLSSTPLLSSAVLAVTALVAGADAARRSELLPRLASGELLMAVAVDENSRHAPFRVTTQAVAEGDGYVLNGRKTLVLDGHVAEHLIVSARTGGAPEERGGITLFLIDAKAPGVSITRSHIVDSRGVATVELRGVKVASGSVLGKPGEGATVLDAVLDAGRVVLAAELLGIAQESFERTLTYLRERDQFGVKIGSFQALQHRAAHLFCEIELTRSVVLRALQALDGQEANRSTLVSLAKARASEVARIATNEAVQMHGGIGVTDEFDIGFFMKRARAAAETLGDAYFHTDRFAQLAGY